MIDAGKSVEADKKELRKFGIFVGALFVAIAGYFLWFRRAGEAAGTSSPLLAWFVGLAGAVLLIAGLVAPMALAAVYRGWMKAAAVMMFINTRIILFIVFVALIIPIGFLARVLGKDMIDSRLDKEAESYWIIRNEGFFEKRKMERQF